MSTNSALSQRRSSPRTSLLMSSRPTLPRRPLSSLDRFSPRLCRRRATGSRASGPGSLQWLLLRRLLRRRRTSGPRTAGTPATTPASAAGASSSASSRRAPSRVPSRRRVPRPLRIRWVRHRQLPWSRSPRSGISEHQVALSKAFVRCLRL
jgi:hypothetical protein